MDAALAAIASARPEIEVIPLQPAVVDDAAFIWPDAAGNPFAVCRYVGGAEEILLPALGKVWIDDGTVRAGAFALGDRDRLRDAYHRFALPLLLQSAGAEMLHASAVRGPRGVVAFCGAPGAGKSTTSYALAQRGHTAVCDDALVWLAGNTPRALSLPFRFRLCDDVVARFPQHARRPTERPPEAEVESAPLAAVCVLTAGSAAKVTRLSAATAFEAVFRHAFAFHLAHTGRNAQMAATYLDLVANVPAFTASVGTRLDSIDAFLDDVEASLPLR